MGLGQRALAARAGASQSTVSYLETAKPLPKQARARGRLRGDLVRIANTLGLLGSVASLLAAAGFTPDEIAQEDVADSSRWRQRAEPTQTDALLHILRSMEAQAASIRDLLGVTATAGRTAPDPDAIFARAVERLRADAFGASAKDWPSEEATDALLGRLGEIFHEEVTKSDP